MLRRFIEKRRKLREAYKRVTHQHVIALAKAKNNKITPGVLATQLGLTTAQAHMKLSQMMMQGVFKLEYDQTTYVSMYVLTHPELYDDENLVLPTLTGTPDSSLSDANVIKIAAKAKGQITAAALCVATECTIDQAREKLQELQHKGVFEVDAHESGKLIYFLPDWETFQDLIEMEEEE